MPPRPQLENSQIRTLLTVFGLLGPRMWPRSWNKGSEFGPDGLGSVLPQLIEEGLTNGDDELMTES